MLNLIGLSQKELATEMIKIAAKPFRAKQIWDWIYVKKTYDFAQFNNFPKILRAKLAEN